MSQDICARCPETSQLSRLGCDDPGHPNGVSQDIGIACVGQFRRMSKARLVITAVVVEGRSQSEVAREYGVSQGWISRLVARYRAEGEKAFEPRSRRPHTNPTRLPQPTIELIVTLRNDLLSKGLDHGPHTIAWHLRHHHGLTVSVNS